MSSRRAYDDMDRQLLPSDLSPRELSRHEDRSGSRHRRSLDSRSRSRSPSSRKKYAAASGGSTRSRPAYRSRSRERERDGGRSHGGGGGGGRGRSRSKSPMSRRRHQGGSRVIPENPSPNKCLGVFGLSLRTTERDLRDVFSRYGPIEECTVVIDAQTGRSRGFSFIYFESMEDAKAAKESCNGIEIDGRRIRVDFSITQRAHTPTPGIYMGKPTVDRGYGYGRRGRRDDNNRRRSPSPHYNRRRSRYSRSRSYSPRKYY